MNKEELIYKFIGEQIFPNVNWKQYNLHNHKGVYITCKYWCKIRDIFSLTTDETIQHLNTFIHSTVNVPPDFTVALEKE
jgi:hypothetical protein